MDKTLLKTAALPARWQEVATALVKHFGLTEGKWRVTLEFGPISGLNAEIGMGAPLTPCALVPTMGLSLRRVEALDSLSVDAAVVNPKPAALVLQ